MIRTIAIQTENGLFVGVEPIGTLTGRKRMIFSGEKFLMESLESDVVSLRAGNGLYLSVEGESGPVVAVRNEVGPRERFKVRTMDDGRTVLKAYTDRYLRVDDATGLLLADHTDLQYADDLFRLTSVALAPASQTMQLQLMAAQRPDQPWHCGVISATRLLLSYGHSVTLDQMINEIGRLRILGKEVDIGNRTDVIAERMRVHDGDSTHATFITFEFLRKLLAEGKPVATLLYLGERQASGWDINIPWLHWVVVSGFDDGTDEVELYRPEFAWRTTMPYDDFLDEWRWSTWAALNVSSWGDLSLYDAIRFNVYGAIDNVLGRNAAFWIDRVEPTIPKTGRNLGSYLSSHPQRDLPKYEFRVEGTGVSDCNLVRAINSAESKASNHFIVPRQDLRIDLAKLQESYRDRFWRDPPIFGARKCEFSADAFVHNTRPDYLGPWTPPPRPPRPYGLSSGFSIGLDLI